jgi:hypothetical protein
MTVRSEPAHETPELVRASRALVARARALQHLLLDTCEKTNHKIIRSEELIKQTDETLARWGSLAAPYPGSLGLTTNHTPSHEDVVYPVVENW